MKKFPLLIPVFLVPFVVLAGDWELDVDGPDPCASRQADVTKSCLEKGYISGTATKGKRLYSDCVYPLLRGRGAKGMRPLESFCGSMDFEALALQKLDGCSKAIDILGTPIQPENKDHWSTTEEHQTFARAHYVTSVIGSRSREGIFSYSGERIEKPNASLRTDDFWRITAAEIKIGDKSVDLLGCFSKGLSP